MKASPLQQKYRGLISAVTAVLLFLSAAAAQQAPWSQNTSPLPAPTGFVNDYVGVIDPGTKQGLEAKLKELRDTSNPSVEIAVAVVKTTGDRDIFDYSLAVARGWKIGSKADDNPSALLLIAIDDRKYFTQVSRDLEDELPDAVAGTIQRQYLVPEFKKANYSKGIADTVDAYITTIRNKGNPPVASTTPENGRAESGDSSPLGILCCAGIFLILLIIMFARNNRGGPSAGDRGRWGGGGFGGGGGGISSALPWIIGGLLSGGGGGGSSSSSDWGGSSGGGWGGFGGGGDFGGGGSGGSW